MKTARIAASIFVCLVASAHAADAWLGPAPRIDPYAAFHHDFPTDETGEFVLRRDLMDDLADPEEE